MPLCKSCDEEVDTLQSVRHEGRSKRMCEDCAQEVNDAQEVEQDAQQAMRGMMEYKGR